MTNPIIPTKPTIASYYQRARHAVDLYNDEVYQALKTQGNPSGNLSFDSIVANNRTTDPSFTQLIQKRKEATRNLRQIEEGMQRDYGEAQYFSYFLELPFEIMSINVPQTFVDDTSYRTLYQQLIEQGKSLVAFLRPLFDNKSVFIDDRDFRNALINIEMNYNHKGAELAAIASKRFQTTMIAPRIDLDAGLGIQASRFPFDPTGLNPLNHISETVTVSNHQQDNAKYIIPRHAPFFVDGLKVSRIQEDGRLIPFVLNEDFMCAGLFADILEHTVDGKLVASSIIFDDVGVNGEFLIEYQTLGGHYTLDDDGFAKALEKFIDSPMMEDWGEVVGKPLELPAEKTQHDITEFRSFEDVVNEVRKLREVINRLADIQEREERDEGFSRLIASMRQYVSDAESIYNRIRELRDSDNNSNEIDTLKVRLGELTNKIDADVSHLRTELGNMITTKVSEVSSQVTNTLLPEINKKLEKVKRDVQAIQVVANSTENLDRAKTELQQDYNTKFGQVNTAIERLRSDMGASTSRPYVQYTRAEHPQGVSTGDGIGLDRNIAASGLLLESYNNNLHHHTRTQTGWHVENNGSWLSFNENRDGSAPGFFHGIRVKDVYIESIRLPNAGGSTQSPTFSNAFTYLRDEISDCTTRLSSAESKLANALNGTQLFSAIKVGTSNDHATMTTMRLDGRTVVKTNAPHIATDFIITGNPNKSVSQTLTQLQANHTNLVNQLGLNNTSSTSTGIQNGKALIVNNGKVSGMNAVEFVDSNNNKGDIKLISGNLVANKPVKASDFVFSDGTSLKTKLDQIVTSTSNQAGLSSDKLQAENAIGNYSKIIGKIPWVRNDGRIHIGKGLRFTKEGSTSESAGNYIDINYVWDSQVSKPGTDFRGVVFCDYLVPRSDKRLKENIRRIDNSVELVKQLNGYQYTFKETNRPSMGVIAQEVEKILPELVHADAESGIKAVNYNGLIALLIETVKAQDARIAKLEEIIQQQL